MRLGALRLGLTEESGAGATPLVAPASAQYDALDFNVRPPYDTWVDLCTVHLTPGAWLVGGEAFQQAGDDTQTWCGIYVHATDTYYCLTYCHMDAAGESSGYRTVYTQDLIFLDDESDVSLRWRSRGTPFVIPQYVTVAAKNDERTIDGDFWFTDAAGVDLTHLSAVPVDGLDYLRAVVEDDVLLAVKQDQYPVMQMDLPEGRWLILANFATTGLGSSSGGLLDHAAGMMSVGGDLLRYVDDGERGGGHGYNPIFNLHGIEQIGPSGATVQALATGLTADSDNFSVLADWGILDHFGSPVVDPPVGSYNTGSLIAIRVPGGDDAKSSIISRNITANADQWTDGPQVSLDEGNWLVWGIGHLNVDGPPHGFMWGVEIEVDGVEYAIAAREGWGDPAGESLVASSVAVLLTIPPGGFSTVTLRGWITAFPGTMYSETIFTVICPEVFWTPGPGPGQALASCITAVRLPIDVTSFPPLNNVVTMAGALGTLPFAIPTVELYRVPV